MSLMPHQTVTRAVGGTVSVTIIRDPADGAARYAVSYQSGGTEWLSRHRFLPSTRSMQAHWYWAISSARRWMAVFALGSLTELPSASLWASATPLAHVREGEGKEGLAAP